MEAKVLRDFTDKEARETFKKNSTWKGTKARFEEINEAGQKRYKSDYLQVEESPKTADKKATKERKLDTETK